MPKTGESGFDRRRRSSTASKRPQYYKDQRLMDEPSRQGLESNIEAAAKAQAENDAMGWPFGALGRAALKQAGRRHNKLYPPGARTDVSPDESRKDVERWKSGRRNP